jgi:hypothetical protein
VTQILYTPELANRALPLVRRIVEDLVRDYTAWRARVQEYEAASAATDDGAAARTAGLQAEVQRLADAVRDCLAELAALGVECKGLDVGLVDFPGEIDGEAACLCWKLGEPAVAWWHRPDAGFAGRQPLPGAALPAAEASR